MTSSAATTTRIRRLGSRRLARADWSHPLRRVFGQSRGVSWGVIFLVLVVGLMLVRPLAMSALSWHRTAALLTERRAEVDQLQQRNRDLKAEVAYFGTSRFIAEQARRDGMVEPGERSYVMREIVHPENTAAYAITRLRNATVNGAVTIDR